jgi:hypothetical protein
VKNRFQAFTFKCNLYRYNWESQSAFFFPRLLFFGATALGLAASIPQSLGGIFRGDEDALLVLLSNMVFFSAAAGLTAVDLKKRKSALERLQRELALGDMQVGLALFTDVTVVCSRYTAKKHGSADDSQ